METTGTVEVEFSQKAISLAEAFTAEELEAACERMLAKAKARIEVVDRPDGRHTTVWPSSLEPRDWQVPGDPSQGAFLVVAALLAERGEVG